MLIRVKNLDFSDVDNLLQFLSNNEESINFFHPHEFTKEAICEIIRCRKLDEYILLYMDDSLAGYGMLRGWDSGYSIPSLGIEIDKNFRGSGLGRVMMEILHHISRVKGATKVRLTVMKDNSKAIELYKSLGYEFHDYSEDRKEGILML